MTGAQASPLAMSVASTRKRPLPFELHIVRGFFALSRSWQAGTLALQSLNYGNTNKNRDGGRPSDCAAGFAADD